MEQYWVKLTNCTCYTGGSKIPIRKRHNQNISLVVNEYLLNNISKKRFIIERYGNTYTTNYSSKITIIRILK